MPTELTFEITEEFDFNFFRHQGISVPQDKVVITFNLDIKEAPPPRLMSKPKGGWPENSIFSQLAFGNLPETDKCDINIHVKENTTLEGFVSVTDFLSNQCEIFPYTMNFEFEPTVDPRIVLHFIINIAFFDKLNGSCSTYFNFIDRAQTVLQTLPKEDPFYERCRSLIEVTQKEMRAERNEAANKSLGREWDSDEDEDKNDDSDYFVSRIIERMKDLLKPLISKAKENLQQIQAKIHDHDNADEKRGVSSTSSQSHNKGIFAKKVTGVKRPAPPFEDELSSSSSSSSSSSKRTKVTTETEETETTPPTTPNPTS